MPEPSAPPDNLETEFVAEGYALSALVNLILVLADNKYFLGRRLSQWCPGGPSLESAVAAAALAQEELGHARALYPLLEAMPVTEAPAPPSRAWGGGAPAPGAPGPAAGGHRPRAPLRRLVPRRAAAHLAARGGRA